jgi:GAF domain-containing protein
MFEEKYWSECTFEWRARGISSSDEAHCGRVADIIQQNYQHNEYGYFSECHDAEELEPENAELLLSRGVRAFIHCGIVDGEHFLGCVGFDDACHARIWTRKEHEVLKTFADIMGSFLLNQSRIKKTAGWKSSFSPDSGYDGFLCLGYPTGYA